MKAIFLFLFGLLCFIAKVPKLICGFFLGVVLTFLAYGWPILVYCAVAYMANFNTDPKVGASPFEYVVMTLFAILLIGNFFFVLKKSN